MKLVKLSLAAVVAAGAFSAANAVALDEAIQNVDLHGMLRYRYDSTREVAGGVKSGVPAHKLKAKIKVSSEIADNFKAHGTIQYDVKDASYSEKQNSETNNAFRVREAYLEYNNFDTSFKVGKMEIGSIWTDGLIGDGVTITNNSIDGVTFAAYMFDNFDKTNGDLVTVEDFVAPEKPEVKPENPLKEVAEKKGALTSDDLKVINDAIAAAGLPGAQGMQAQITLSNAKLDMALGNEVTVETLKADKAIAQLLSDALTKPASGEVTSKDFDKAKANALSIYDHNLYGVAALVDFEPISAQAWVSYLNKVGTFYAIDAAFDSEVADGVKVLAHAQYAGNSLKGDLKDAIGGANGNFIGLEAGVEVAGLDAKAGFVTFGKKDKWTTQVLHDKGQLINSGEIIMDGYNGTVGKHTYFFGEFGYTFEGLRAGFDILGGTQKVGSDKVKLFEITPRLSYKYSDKLSFSTFYAYGQAKLDGDKEKVKQLRLEAKYKF